MKILSDISVSEVAALIDKKWLFSAMWHLKGNASEGEKALKSIADNISDFGFEPKVIYKKFSSKYKDGTLSLFSDDGAKIDEFKFNDVIFNKFSKSKIVSADIVLISATVGDKVKTVLDKRHQGGDFKDYFYLNGYAAALAEAATEYGHLKACEEFGLDRENSFRLSPGYPAWPGLADQLKICEIIPLKKIGVTVSESFQLHPEFSTTSLIFHTIS
jgi:5-methyltetrahydrofolate--homocysteine methyltransferase